MNVAAGSQATDQAGSGGVNDRLARRRECRKQDLFKKEECKMMLWLMYFATSTGEACDMVDKAIKELKTEDPKYAQAPFMRINIDLDLNQGHKYEVKNVPCIYAGKEKMFEYEPGMTYEDIKSGVAKCMDRFINDAIL